MAAFVLHQWVRKEGCCVNSEQRAVEVSAAAQAVSAGASVGILLAG